MAGNYQGKIVGPGSSRSEEKEEIKGSGSSKRHCIVDLDQFRNREVGEGFQAKHVVRQSNGRVGGKRHLPEIMD